MTSTNIIAGLSIATIVGLAYYINELLADIAALKNMLNDKADKLTNAALENQHLKRKLEKIRELI